MAETQPVTIPVSCLDEHSFSEEPPTIESDAAGTTNQGEEVNDDCVRSSSVEVDCDVQGDARNDEEDDTPHATNYNTVIAGVCTIKP